MNYNDDDLLNPLHEIQRLLVLSKVGQYFVGKCPFHDQEIPLFSISIKERTYYCVECAKKGSAKELLNFLMDVRDKKNKADIQNGYDKKMAIKKTSAEKKDK